MVLARPFRSAKAALDAALKQLTGDTADAYLADLGITFSRTEDRATVDRVLREWASWDLSWSWVQEQRTAYLMSLRCMLKCV